MELGDAVFVTEPRPDITQACSAAGGGDGPRYAGVPLSWAPEEAARSAREGFRFDLTGWSSRSCPTPVNFEAATAFIVEDDMSEVLGCGPEASKHIAVAQHFADAGYVHLALISAAPDPEKGSSSSSPTRSPDRFVTCRPLPEDANLRCPA